MRHLVLVEGETEIEFYRRLIRDLGPQNQPRIRELEGNWNLDQKVLVKADQYAEHTNGDRFRIHLCIDQDRPEAVHYEHGRLVDRLNDIPGFDGLTPIIANKMLESLFFADIESIYGFLRTKHSQRNTARYRQFRNFDADDLSALFKANGKTYAKGIRCASLAENLNMRKIYNAAEEIRRLIAELNKN